ncbi:hypothetical protein Mgra_00008311 [Meloidogyne graminicola]|uniref:Uncharacterized protein n=1 Tax=Meloidogyne graminicola TaxID=189291 RepID=A0A8S9ZG78_9BILA|nr:hypothetical protein Mgra_00008311 [Meloidogyne graminicola]
MYHKIFFHEHILLILFVLIIVLFISVNSQCNGCCDSFNCQAVCNVFCRGNRYCEAFQLACLSNDLR